MIRRLFRPALRDDTRGFTLLEVLVAVVVLGLAYVAVLQNLSASMRNITRLEQGQARVLSRELEFDGILALDPEETEAYGFPVFAEGRVYRLLKVTSPDGRFVSLKLERK